MENISAGTTMPRPLDTDASDNNCDDLAAAFSLCVTSVEQSATAFDLCSEPAENRPADRPVCTRSAAALVPADKPSQKIVQMMPDLYIGSHDFEYWVDLFLSIPVDDYLQIDESILQKIESSYHSYSKNPAVQKNITTIVKIKHLLNRLLCNWCTKQNKEQTKKQLISLYEYAQNKINLVHYVQNWIFMKCFKDILYGRPVSESTRQTFVSIMNEIIYAGSISGISRSSLPCMDIISLAILYYTGGLHSFEDGANYERSFKMLDLHHNISQDTYLFFSPISFTALDYIRFSPQDLIQKLNEQQKEMVPGAMAINVVQMVVSVFMYPENLPPFKLWCEENHVSFPIYEDVRQILIDAYEIIGMAYQRKSSFLKDVTNKKDGLYLRMRQCEKATFGTKNDCFGLFNFLRAEIILSEKTLKPRRRYAKVAALYAATAERSPNHWSSAYHYYCKAGIWDAAANAIKHYAHYWAEKNEDVAEYWSDVYGRELQATRANSGNQTSDAQEQYDQKQYDIDTILREFADDPPAVTRKHKDKKPRHYSVPAGSCAEQHDSGNQSVNKQDQVAQSAGRQDNFRPCRPVIKASPFAVNYHDGLPGEYQIKAAQGAIRPFEKLLSKHWNPLIKKTLNLIRTARNACDIDQERRIYQKLLNNPTLKTCIGIERIWEEYAWTELHQFDDCFKTRAVPTSMKPEAQKWVKMARDCYIMPSLAYCLNLDQICANIKPEAVWDAVLQLVEQPELAEPAVNQEIRFRLRCLFSSMGHTYSLCAMASPNEATQLMQVARQWYSYKSIDLQYDRCRRSVLASPPAHF